MEILKPSSCIYGQGEIRQFNNLISYKAESILNYIEAGANQGESLSLLIPESNLSQINLFFRTGFSKEKFMYGISLDTKIPLFCWAFTTKGVLNFPIREISFYSVQ